MSRAANKGALGAWLWGQSPPPVFFLSPLARLSEGKESADAASCNILVVLLFIGVYTTLSLADVVHYVLAGAAAFGVMLITWKKLDEKIKNWFYIFIISIILISVLASVENGRSIIMSIHPAITFCYNFFIGMAIYFGLIQMGRERIQKTFCWIAIIMVVGAALEVAGPLKPVSDWFRDATLSEGIYNSNVRDLMNYGAIRPKFFASEPSTLGLYTGLAVFLWLCAIRVPKASQNIQAMLLILIGFYFIRSPSLFVGPLTYVMMRIMTPATSWRIARLGSKIVPWVYIAMVLLIPFIFLYIIATDPDPPRYIVTGSFFERTIEPYLFVRHVVTSHPLFGTGLLADETEYYQRLAFDVIGQFAVFSEGTLSGLADVGEGVSNAFWSSVMTFGIVGSLALAVLLSRFLRAANSPITLLRLIPITWFTFWQAFGRVNSPVAWLTFFAVVALCSLMAEPAHPLAAEALVDGRPSRFG